MKYPLQLILIFSLSSLVSYGQNKENPVHELQNYSVISNYTNLSGIQYLTPDSSFYLPLTKYGYTFCLPKGNIRGTVVFPGLIPDSAMTDDVFKVINPFVAKNIAVLYLSIGKQDWLFSDKETKSLDSLLNTALVKCNLRDKPIVFVGMSTGGTMIMRHAEYCLKGKSEFNLKPSGLVLIDAPLDFVRWWYSREKEKRDNYNEDAYFEANWTNYFLEKNLNGTPLNALQNYINYSPYVYSDPIKSKLTLYKNLPILAITEPDILWWMEERGKDYYSINSIDLAAFINDLRIRGNKKAKLLTTTGKGYRANGVRHPHSWSIVDTDELVKWCTEIIVTK